MNRDEFVVYFEKALNEILQYINNGYEVESVDMKVSLFKGDSIIIPTIKIED